MRTISLRQFRDSIPDLHEQVVVQRRRQDGEYETLGQWTPLRTPTAEPTVSVFAFPVKTSGEQAERDAILNKINRGKKP